MQPVCAGATLDPDLRNAFDDLYEAPLSRSMLDISGLIRGERAISNVLASRPDIVHVHTPIASFITRVAIRHWMIDREQSAARAGLGGDVADSLSRTWHF